MENNTARHISGLILAGGRARRMGEQDKGLVQLAGTKLIERCILSLSPQVDRIVISANRNIDQYQKYSFPVLKDTAENYDGPLAGLQRALEMSPDMPVLVVPCDAPLVSAHLAKRLFTALQENNCLAAIPHDGTRMQPLFGLFSPLALEPLKQYLDSGQRKVETWISSLPHSIVDFSDQAESFMNINTESDLQQAESYLANNHY